MDGLLFLLDHGSKLYIKTEPTALGRNAPVSDAFLPQVYRRCVMKVLFWIGLAMVVCWGILWLGIKIAVGAVHLLLILGAILIGWALLRREVS